MSETLIPPRSWTGLHVTGAITSIALRPPMVDEASAAALEEAAASLGTSRGLEWVGDAGVEVHLLASLIAQARARLEKAVGEAVDQGYNWAEIAHLLGTTEAETRKRFAHRS